MFIAAAICIATKVTVTMKKNKNPVTTIWNQTRCSSVDS